MIDDSMLEGLEIPDQREHSTPHLWAKLAEWKMANPEGMLGPHLARAGEWQSPARGETLAAELFVL
jgi:hypothetical protein